MRDHTTTKPTRSSHLGRRTLVRAGATAAWTVPVIAMAAPAHATSCSGGVTTLSAVTVTDSKTQTGKPKLTVTVQVQVCNTGETQTCDLYATASGSGASTRLNAFSVGDWPAVEVGGGGSKTMMASAPANEQLGSGSCTTYLVSYLLHDGSGEHTVTITFATGNGGVASVNVTTTR
ncbi:hypothetical protein [Nocardioides cynanchi]|uniref:hypothetical protein n=1 Tax=Nocardioides cynanchi TaxID=2558918 RepID=UPI001244DD1B|nr:hypothetical protein [Nocardioides cynanchi]